MTIDSRGGDRPRPYGSPPCDCLEGEVRLCRDFDGTGDQGEGEILLTLAPSRQGREDSFGVPEAESPAHLLLRPKHGKPASPEQTESAQKEAKSESSSGSE